MKAYITKYALSKGIFESDDAEPGPFEGCITIGNTIYNRTDWAKTPTEAIKKAEQMRQQKIRSLERISDKIKQKRFNTFIDYNKLKV